MMSLQKDPIAIQYFDSRDMAEDKVEPCRGRIAMVVELLLKIQIWIWSEYREQHPQMSPSTTMNVVYRVRAV